MSVIHLLQVGCYLAVPLVLLLASAIALVIEPRFIWSLCQMQPASPLKLLYEWRAVVTPESADE